jgi:hypothetical protein
MPLHHFGPHADAIAYGTEGLDLPDLNAAGVVGDLRALCRAGGAETG